MSVSVTPDTLADASIAARLRLQKRDGSLAPFDGERIRLALEKAFRAEMSLSADQTLPAEAASRVASFADAVVRWCIEESGCAAEMGLRETPLQVEQIQDEVERVLMAGGEHRVARRYVLYREQHSEKRRASALHYRRLDGTEAELDQTALQTTLEEACAGLGSDVIAAPLLSATVSALYSGISEAEIVQASVMAARGLVEVEPAYTYVAARLLLGALFQEAVGQTVSRGEAGTAYRAYFPRYVQEAVEAELLDPAMLGYDLDRLGAALRPERDLKFAYLGLQTLYDRYFLQISDRRVELPQVFWMRVAMGLSLNEADKNARAIEFYEIISDFLFTPATPTLFNSGTRHSQLSSCYLTTVGDDLENIFKCIQDNALLSKWAGGLGNDWTQVRSLGAAIKGTSGRSQGIIPFLKVASDTAVAVNQCFAPETILYTAKGAKSIAQVETGDFVLGKSGLYREVSQKFIYGQTDPMVAITLKHAVNPISVTDGHPFYALQNIPLGQSNARTMEWLRKGKARAEWVDAGHLQKGDYIAQIIPKQIVPVAGLTEDDARLYGILLGDGHLSKGGLQWGVSGNPKRDTHLDFVRRYLTQRGIHTWETGRGDTYCQIHWSSGRGVVRDTVTGRILRAGEATLPFTQDDIYDDLGHKHIAPRLLHLPLAQARALVHGLLETDGGISRGKEIYFTNTSRPLIDGLRYQLLRLGIPTAGQYRERQMGHIGRRSDGSLISMTGTVKAYDLHIPAVSGLAELVACRPIVKKNWIEHEGALFSRVKDVCPAKIAPTVYDLKVDVDESYMTESGLAHNGGKRKGAVCAYLETWHLDIEEFLELRKNTGDDRRRTHDMNTANWIPDLFMKRVQAGQPWTLFSPSDVPDLHDLYGKAFEEKYAEYERRADAGEIALFKRLPALDLWRKMLSMLFETGHPWMTWKDPSNLRSPQDHVGVVHNSNLCTEILLNNSEDETAVCNLGSVNLAAHVTTEGLNLPLLETTITTAVRMLDNVIELNYYPTKEAKTANMRHRPVGLGLMGFQDALYTQGISYASTEAVKFADESMEALSYFALRSSATLAKERGKYPTFPGSKWDRGLLPLDTLALVDEVREEPLRVSRTAKMDWEPVRQAIREHGIRNSNVLAIAPTATISNIIGVSQSIEPTYKNLYVKSNLSGEFIQINDHLVRELKAAGLWDAEMREEIKYCDGVLSEIDRIPAVLKERYLTAFEVGPEWLIECAAHRQKWLDMGQSLNLYLAQPSGKKLGEMYFLAWHKGLKTTYYLRTLAATQVEKSTVDVNRFGVQPRWMKNKSASGDIAVERSAAAVPDAAPAVCELGEDCEACQ